MFKGAPVFSVPEGVVPGSDNIGSEAFVTNVDETVTVVAVDKYGVVCELVLDVVMGVEINVFKLVTVAGNDGVIIVLLLDIEIYRVVNVSVLVVEIYSVVNVSVLVVEIYGVVNISVLVVKKDGVVVYRYLLLK